MSAMRDKAKDITIVDRRVFEILSDIVWNWRRCTLDISLLGVKITRTSPSLPLRKKQPLI